MTHDRDQVPASTPTPWTDDTEFHLPEDHWPLPQLVHTEKSPTEPSHSAFIAVANSTEYGQLRSMFRRFAFPMTIAGLASYFVYVVGSIYAPAFMAQPLFGALNVGMVAGLAQFAVTWTWTAVYVNYATKRLDPVAKTLKERLEKEALA